MINRYSIQWIENWCVENGWTDLFVERPNHYWAFPPGGVMPEPIPYTVLRTIKRENGMTRTETLLFASAIFTTILSVISTYCWKCPMPLVGAFAFGAVIVALFEPEEY
jgi:hypothetical protein